MIEAQLGERFRRFSAEAQEESLLYSVLAKAVAEDDELLALAARAPDGQPVPNLFMAAVHHLLLAEGRDPLASFYADLTPTPRAAEAAVPAFRAFCLAHADALAGLLETRRVQTNEVQRASYLYPAFSLIYRELEAPLALIEIGASAGLLLLWNRFRYRYGDAQLYGNPCGSLTLSAALRGRRPFVPDLPPPVSQRIGVDLHPLDVRRPEDCGWLRALVWPESHERRQRLDAAIAEWRAHPVRMVEGDGVDRLGPLAREIPTTSTLVVFHLHVANQMSADQQARLFAEIAEIGRTRTVAHLYNNVHPERGLYLDVVGPRSQSRRRLGLEDGHGRWFEWDPRAVVWSGL